MFAFNSVSKLTAEKIWKPDSEDKFGHTKSTFRVLFLGHLWKKNLFYANMESTLNGEISTKSVYISINNNTNLKISKILSIYTIWDRLSQKPSHATVPLKGQ